MLAARATPSSGSRRSATTRRSSASSRRRSSPRATDDDEHAGDGRHGAGAGAQRPHLPARRLGVFPHRVAAHLRPAGAARSRGHEDGRQRGRRRILEGRRPRLRAVEGQQAGGAVVGSRHRARPARLAHRVLGDGPAAAGRGPDRPARRRHRPDLPAPRERDRAGRGRHAPAVRALLGARRAPVRRGREDVEVARQRLHACPTSSPRAIARRRCATCCCRRTTASSSTSPGPAWTRPRSRCGRIVDFLARLESADRRRRRRRRRRQPA